MASNMRAIILAAGRGSRMGGLTSDQPKCRTVLGGRELIDYQIDSISQSGIKNISIVTGYLSDSFDFDLTYFHNQRWSQTNMVYSLLSASEWLKRYDCIVSYSDIVYPHKVVEKLKSSTADIAITYDTNWKSLWSLRFENPLSDAETFKLNGGTVTEIGKKTSCYSEIEGQFMGLVKFTPNGWRVINKYISKLSSHEIDRLDMTALLQLLITKGVKVIGVPIDDQWFEVDTESDLEVYERILNNG